METLAGGEPAAGNPGETRRAGQTGKRKRTQEGEKKGGKRTTEMWKQKTGNLRRELREIFSRVLPLQSPSGRLWQDPCSDTRRRVVLDRRIPALQDL